MSADNEGYLQGLQPEWLDAQLSYLVRNYHILSLDELLTCFDEKRPIPKRSVVITFDDGFRDNYERAFPIFRRYGIPATVFLTTECINTGVLPWSQRLGFLFQNTPVRKIIHHLFGNIPLEMNSIEDRFTAYLKAKATISSMDWAKREPILSDLSEILEIDPPKNRMLTWDNVREMENNSWSFGAHSYSHTLLGRVSFYEAQKEMERSLHDIRSNLGIDNPPFCFPAGSMTPELIELARELGFRSSFISDWQNRINTLGNATPFSLRRIGLPNGPAIQLEAELDGPFFAIRRLYHS